MTYKISNFLKLANKLADHARDISLYYFKKKIKIKNKFIRGFDPITIADIKIQKELNKIVEQYYPSHSILGEEESYIKSSEYEWCIDPIDGTKSFIEGAPMWGTLISLSRKRKIILGIADIPVLDERYIGYANVAYKISKGKKSKLKVRKTTKLSEATLNTTSPYLFNNNRDQSAFEKLSKKVKSTRLGGDCYSYCLLADGFVDLVVESSLKPWDIRALEPIIVNAGGIIKTWENKKIFNGGSIIASSSRGLFKKARSILNKKNPV